VRQVGHLSELYEDVRSEKYKTYKKIYLNSKIFRLYTAVVTACNSCFKIQFYTFPQNVYDVFTSQEKWIIAWIARTAFCWWWSRLMLHDT